MFEKEMKEMIEKVFFQKRKSNIYFNSIGDGGVVLYVDTFGGHLINWSLERQREQEAVQLLLELCFDAVRVDGDSQRDGQLVALAGGAAILSVVLAG